MKSYKTINSKAIRDKIERLNNVTLSNIKDIDDMIFIFVHTDGYCHYTNGREAFINSKFDEITQADFLALPEPFKIGDWVKHWDYEGSIMILNIKTLIGNSGFIATSGRKYYDVLDYCTKLTPEQIKVLGLED